MPRPTSLTVVFLAFLALTSGAAAAPWTQAGYSAARTGHPPGAGPAVDDVAFHVRIPADVPLSEALPAGPLLHDGNAYVPVREYDSVQRPVTDGVIRVDLATAEVAPFVLLDRDDTVSSIATDGTHLFVSSGNALQAYDLADGERVWRWENPRLVPAVADWHMCTQPAVTEGTVYHSCTRMTNRPPRAETFIAAVDVATGEERWVWTPENATERGDAGAQPVNTFVPGFSVIGAHVVAPVVGLYYETFRGTCFMDDMCVRGSIANANISVTAFDASTGTARWRHPVDLREVQVRAMGLEQRLAEFAGASIHPTGTSSVVYVQANDEVRALNMGDGGVLWSETVGEEDVRPTQFTISGFALAEDALFTTSTETLYRIGRDNPQDQWRRTLDPAANEIFGAGDLALAEDSLYAVAFERRGNGTSLYNVDASTGDVRWRHRVPASPDVGSEYHVHSLGEGVIALVGDEGSFRVIGTTPASLDPVAKVDSAYADPGETVRVDLSATGSGVHGPATRYRVEWGDGAVTPWQADPLVTHAYNATGDVDARFIVGNVANQTASTFVTFHVGEREPNVLSTAFAPGNQDLTFGILGIVVAISGGAVGVTQRYRKRARLERFLAALEKGFEVTKDRPGECEAFLETRKARARSLLMDGDLTEEQFSVVERRVTELHQQHRTTLLDARFQFLPHGMVEAIKKMLADGRLSTWERDALDALLERDDALSAAQKERVRRQLDHWFAHDASADSG